jgi:hypothetical protein
VLTAERPGLFDIVSLFPLDASQRLASIIIIFLEEEEEIIRLPWRGQCGRAAAARALCACRCWLRVHFRCW